MDIFQELINLKVGQVLENVNIKEYTTYKAGGRAIALVIPNNLECLITLLKYLRNKDIKHKILGRGSNLIFNDSGYNGVLIKLDNFNNLDIKSNEIIVGAGYPLIKLATRLSRMGYAGIEFATGIPGTVGGAVFMNAGAYKSDMGYIVKSVKVLTPDYKIKELTNYDMDFHYRTSFLQKHPNYVCLEMTIILKKGNPEEIMQLIEDRRKRRVESQPLEYPSAGSVFRNPEGDFAGRLIEEIGYKGHRIGDAEVSQKHANFIINVGEARGEDIKALIIEIKEKIKEQYGIELKVEQEFVE